jgi:hypothetical protein
MFRQVGRVLALVGIVVLAVVPVYAAPTPVPAPAFTLELFNEQTLRLADLKGTAVILLFWANW